MRGPSWAELGLQNFVHAWPLGFLRKTKALILWAFEGWAGYPHRGAQLTALPALNILVVADVGLFTIK